MLTIQTSLVSLCLYIYGHDMTWHTYIHTLGVAPSQNASGKWRFGFGIPDPKHVIILVVAGILGRATPNAYIDTYTMSPAKPWNRKVFGHLKTRLFTINTFKHVGFWGPMTYLNRDRNVACSCPSQGPRPAKRRRLRGLDANSWGTSLFFGWLGRQWLGVIPTMTCRVRVVRWGLLFGFYIGTY